MGPNDLREYHRSALQVSMNERRYNDALNHILGLISLDPGDPRWPHKYGDVLRSLRRTDEAAAAYRRAARRYEAAGFPVRATAMMRLAGELMGESGSVRIESDEISPAQVDGSAPASQQPKPLTRAS